MGRITKQKTEVGRVYRVISLPDEGWESYKEEIIGQLCYLKEYQFEPLDKAFGLYIFDSNRLYRELHMFLKLKPVGKKTEAYFINHLKSKGLL